MAAVCHMPFGKYKGHNVRSMQTQYLLWVASLPTVSHRYPNLASEIFEIIHERTANPAALVEEFRNR